MYFRLFDLAHIQNVIDQAEQMLGRHRDLVQIIPQLVRVIQVGKSQGRHTNDRIHRRTDVVAH